MGVGMELPDFDPTAYALGGDPTLTDPRARRLNAFANFGRRYRLRMPFMTQVTDNLWQGGVEPGLILPDFVDFTLSLFPWTEYEFEHELKERVTVEMYDSEEQTFDQVAELADWVNRRRQEGTVLVNCQAGLNRSSLVIATALIASGEVRTGQEAIDLIRARRDPACLCNPAFEAHIRGLTAEAIVAG